MSDWGIHRYEMMPATSKENTLAAKDMVKMGLKAQMFGFCRAMVEDIKYAIDVGMKGVIIEMSAQGYLTGAGNWKPEEMVRMTLEASKMAKDAGLRVVTFHPFSYMCTFDELSSFVKRVTEYAEAYCTVDTAGALTPEGTAFFTDVSRTIRPDLRLESHAHDRGNCMGAANSITAVAHGVSAVHCEMLGFTLPAAQEVAVNLFQMLRMGKAQGLDIKWEKTREVCELIAERTKVKIFEGRPYIGSRLGYSQIGISDSPALRQYKVMEEQIKKGEPIQPRGGGRRGGLNQLLGIVSKKTIGKQSGRGTINLKIWSMGLPDATPDQSTQILEEIKEIVMKDKLYEINDEIFLKVYEHVTGHPALPPEPRKVPEVIKRGLGPNWL